jgi:acetylornithine deacetylase/succinyl-diaminopimelate desuccinylase-like protein
MAARLRAAGFPDSDVQVLVPHPRKGNLVARYRGTGVRPPVLLLAHIDVVEAEPSDWTVPPFTFLEKDGWYYGRGTSDDKAMAAIWIANMIRYRREGFVPDRDIILALTADEEGGDHNGVDWLLREHPDLVQAAFVINEGGGGQIRDGRRILNEIQTSEKVYQTYTLEIHNPGGHSSIPRPDNAINRLAAALTRIAEHTFPVHLTETTRAFFAKMAPLEDGGTAAAMTAIVSATSDPAAAATLSADPYFNAQLRTTCIATMLQAGHAENALPQTAKATVNCRVIPGEEEAAVRRTLIGLIADTGVSITPLREFKPSEPSPLTPEIMGAVERQTERSWPGVPVVPVMVTGATDGLYFRNAGTPTYGVSGLFEDVDDVRAHGRDERMGVQAFHEGREFLYRLVKDLATPPSP